MVIAASTPVWNEPDALLERCRASVAGVVDHHNVFEGGIALLVDGGRWNTQAEMRQAGVAACEKWARARGRQLAWLLQLDADEALVNGELLRPILERWPYDAYPLPYVHESGQVTIAPFKLLRMPARIVACCEYVTFRHSATVWNLAGYAAPDELRDALLRLPFLFHTPGLRAEPIRRAVRLSTDELRVESRPPDAVQWPLPPLTLGKDVSMRTDDDGSPREYEAGDGAYYCEGCGARYDTPGVCTGTEEAPHEAQAVTKVTKGASSSSAKPGTDDGGDGGGSKPKTTAKRKTAAKHKTTAKRKTTAK